MTSFDKRTACVDTRLVDPIPVSAVPCMLLHIVPYCSGGFEKIKRDVTSHSMCQDKRVFCRRVLNYAVMSSVLLNVLIQEFMYRLLTV